MTNKPMLSVERKLLERVVDNRYREKEQISIARHEALWELRALLDEPVCNTDKGEPCPGDGVSACKKCPAQHQGEIDLTPKRLAHAENVIEQQNNVIASLRAELVESYRIDDKQQGEPVAWQYITHPTWDKGEWPAEWTDCTKEAHDDYVRAPLVADWEYRTRKLYAEQPAPVAVDLACDRAYRNGLQRGFALGENGQIEQYQKEFDCYQREILQAGKEKPAPVAVVMPERMEAVPFTTIDRGSKNYKAGYNAAIAKIARLNGVKP
jgi:hypothetical protein